MTYDLSPREQLVNDEDMIEEFAAIVYVACHEHIAPNWTMDLIRAGLDFRLLRVMAVRWRDYEFEPADFADRVERLADALVAQEDS